MQASEPLSDDYGRAVVRGTLYVGTRVAAREDDHSRTTKMRQVLEDQAVAYNEEPGGRAARLDLPLGPELLESIPKDWSPDRGTTYLIDLLFSIPFSPNQLKYDEDTRTEALGELARHLGLDPALVDRLKKTQRDAAKAHRDRDWRRIALLGGGGLALVAITAGAAAPFIGAAVGGAAGLSGAAAMLHGLAVLGGGSLAAGGAGMAGGFWIVTGTGALVGLVGGSSAALLVELGAAGATAELVKLQVSFAEVTLLHESKSKAAEMIGRLATERDEVRARRSEALKRNDDDGPAVKELEEIEEAMSDAMEWMNERLEKS